MAAMQEMKTVAKKADMSISVPFRVLASNSFSNSAGTTVVGSLNLALANLGARAVAMGSAFEFFRISKLRVYSYVDSNGITYDTSGTTKVGLVNGDHCIAFDADPAGFSTAPTTFTPLGQLPHFVQGGPRHLIEINVDRKGLYGSTPGKWYRTSTTGSPAAGDLSAGVVWSACYNQISTASNPYQQIVVEGVLELKGLVSPAMV